MSDYGRLLDENAALKAQLAAAKMRIEDLERELAAADREVATLRHLLEPGAVQAALETAPPSGAAGDMVVEAPPEVPAETAQPADDAAAPAVVA